MSLHPTVAFATAAAWPELVEDDLLAARVLDAWGVDVEAAVWDDPRVDWSRFDAIVIRSCWDYHRKGAEFARWLTAIAPFPLFNPAHVAAWNMHKRYLFDLAAAGVPTVETELVERGGELDLRALVRARGWAGCVVKPAVSLTSYRTERIDGLPSEAAVERAAALARERDTLVQPFQPEILDGELSFVFFDGEYSHCVRKTPRAGDFRSQEEFGGTRALATPSDALIAQARAALAACEEPLLYARVDGVETKGGLLLMELEAIDPTLFLALSPGAPERFARAILARLETGGAGG